jgi:hypothetical protein
MKPITLTDLDGVHFQTRRDSANDVDLTPGALGADNMPSSFMTPNQSSFLDLLLVQSHVVPVTARPVESFKRVLVSFEGYAICSFGGVILTPEGLLEPTWHQQILTESRLYSPRLFELKAAIEDGCAQRGTAVSATVVADAGCDLYLNCKLADPGQGSISVVRALMKWLLPADWQMHGNGNNVAALPPFLSKERAASYYLSELAEPHSCVIGIGDSHTDLGFMALCDYAVMPTNSQIFALFNPSEKKTEST